MTHVQPSTLIRWINPPSIPNSVRLSLFVLSVHLFTLLPVDLLSLSVIQAISGFLILSFVPGFLIVSYAMDELTLTNMLYAIGFSVAFSMIIGYTANSLYLRLPINLLPFAQPTTSLLYIGVSGVLSGICWIVDDGDTTQPLIDQFPTYNFRVVLLLTCIPVWAIVGALLINQHSFNILTLFTIANITVIPVFVYYFDEYGKYYSLTIAAISSALLLQNTVITTYLARGDALGEYSVANDVLQNGFWVSVGTFGSMPRLVVLQPAYSLIMDMSLFWVFKLVHPVLFTIVPLITYLLALRYFSKDVAFLSAVLYIFLPRTYQIISRNTRSGAAIFFIALLLMVILDYDLPSWMKRMFMSVFFIGMMMSHYGISTLVLFAIVVAYLLNTLLGYILKVSRQSQIWFSTVSLFVILYFVWYGYLTGGVFDFLVEAAYGQISSSLFFTGESTAVRSATVSESRGLFGMPPGSYEIMFVGHLLLGIFSSVGISLLYLRHLFSGLPVLHSVQNWLEQNIFPGISDQVLEDTNYIHLAIGMFLFFPLSFGPQIMSAARMFALVMVIIAPLPVLVLKSTRLQLIGAKPILTCICVFLLVTSGFVSATVTHDVSPQPIIDNDRIVESGSTLEQFALYRAYNPKNSIEASNFILEYLPQGATIQKSHLGKFIPGFYEGKDKTPYWNGGKDYSIRFTELEDSNTKLEEYRYLSEPDMVTGTITQRHDGFIFYQHKPLPSYSASNTIYTSGQDEIHN